MLARVRVDRHFAEPDQRSVFIASLSLPGGSVRSPGALAERPSPVRHIHPALYRTQHGATSPEAKLHHVLVE